MDSRDLDSSDSSYRGVTGTKIPRNQEAWVYWTQAAQGAMDSRDLDSQVSSYQCVIGGNVPGSLEPQLLKGPWTQVNSVPAYQAIEGLEVPRSQETKKPRLLGPKSFKGPWCQATLIPRSQLIEATQAPRPQ